MCNDDVTRNFVRFYFEDGSCSELETLEENSIDCIKHYPAGAIKFEIFSLTVSNNNSYPIVAPDVYYIGERVSYNQLDKMLQKNPYDSYTKGLMSQMLKEEFWEGYITSMGKLLPIPKEKGVKFFKVA